MVDTWEDFESALTQAEKATSDAITRAMAAGLDIDKLAELHTRIADVMSALSGVNTYVEDRIASGAVASIAGTQTIVGKVYEVTIAWGERREWDQDALQEALGTELANGPEFIKRKLTVDKRLWDKATPEEQSPYLPALTTKPGTRKITVNRIA